MIPPSHKETLKSLVGPFSIMVRRIEICARQGTAIKIALLLSLIFTSGLASASGFGRNWEDWRLSISPNRCMLKRSYYIHSRDLLNSSRRGFLSNSPYTGAHVRFDVTTSMPYSEYPASKVGRVYFVVQIVAGYGASYEDRVIGVDIGSFSIDARYGVSNRGRSDDYWLSAEQTQVILSRFEDNEAIIVTFSLASGVQLSSTLYPPGNKNFYVWREVFETCAQVNTR